GGRTPPGSPAGIPDRTVRCQWRPGERRRLCGIRVGVASALPATSPERERRLIGPPSLTLRAVKPTTLPERANYRPPGESAAGGRGASGIACATRTSVSGFSTAAKV